MKNKPPFLRLLLDNKKHWPGLLLMILLALLAGVFKTRAATLWGEAVDFGVSGQIDLMMWAAIGMLGFIALDGIRTALHYTVIGQVTERMFRGIRMSLFSILSVAETSVLENHMRSGDIALRACEDTEDLCDIIAGRFGHYIRLVFQAIFAIIVCVLLSWQLAIAYFILLPISLWLLAAVSKPLQKLQSEARGGSGRSADIAMGALTGISGVKIFQLEAEMDRQFAVQVDAVYARTAKAGRIGMGMTTIKYVVTVLQTLVLFIVGAWLVSRGLISIGAVMAFIALAVYVTEAFGLVDSMIFHVKSAGALAGRIYEVLDLPHESPGDAAVLPAATDEYVKFTNLNFAYEGADNPRVLDNLNLTVRAGQKVAIVGASGSGKSTIIKLICRLYGHVGGEFTLFGADGEKISLPDLRKELALVSQESCLFEDSIMENVRYGRQSATEDEIVGALKAANIWDFVQTLPDGVHTKLGEFGSRLSGGQRQRLSIARALVKDTKLILLDEATSALDTQTEQEIQTALDVLLEGRAAVIVAHRLSTVQNADYIYCIENGAVVEEGTPLELYAKGGYYYEMCKMQGVDS
ncbi:MAG: ABC transporter ATP-binding protein/permease [Firmicutes bacterium]|nr:ABC transporter ATP-binding protein/permease [Bacillota bacterium]